MAFLLNRGRIAKHTRQKAHAGVNHRLCGNFSPAHHEITQRHFLNAIMINHALIDPFEATRQKNNASALDPFIGHVLIKYLAPRRQKYQVFFRFLNFVMSERCSAFNCSPSFPCWSFPLTNSEKSTDLHNEGKSRNLQLKPISPSESFSSAS